ncbi:MAG TPA: helix-turn-helix domain-containing protein [Conexibacter sp.]|nr:helix-turn-helix domain-containing protein [Conexibacter sp.]
MSERRRNAWPRVGAGGRSRADLAWSRALAHPVRVEILRSLLEHEPGTPSGFAAALEIPLGVASHHVRRLRDLRLIRIARRTHRRGAVQHHYRLVDREATAQALWRWGVVPDDVDGIAVPAGDDRTDAEEQGRVTMQRVIARLREARERQGVSRATLARRIGISAEQLGRIERGDADPRMSVLLSLATALAVPMRELFAEAEADEPAA